MKQVSCCLSDCSLWRSSYSSTKTGRSTTRVWTMSTRKTWSSR